MISDRFTHLEEITISQTSPGRGTVLTLSRHISQAGAAGTESLACHAVLRITTYGKTWWRRPAEFFSADPACRCSARFSLPPAVVPD
jgi:hypothetical protein